MLRVLLWSAAMAVAAANAPLPEADLKVLQDAGHSFQSRDTALGKWPLRGHSAAESSFLQGQGVPDMQDPLPEYLKGLLLHDSLWNNLARASSTGVLQFPTNVRFAYILQSEVPPGAPFISFMLRATPQKKRQNNTYVKAALCAGRYYCLTSNGKHVYACRWCAWTSLQRGTRRLMEHAFFKEPIKMKTFMKMQNLATEDDVDAQMKRHISAYLNQKNRTLPCRHPATKDQCVEFAAAGQTSLHVQALASPC